MNSKTFARIMLFFPLCTLVESIGYFMLFDAPIENPPILATLNTFWNFLAIFWCVPYGILVLYLLIWSRKKTIEQIQKMFSAAPTSLMFIACGLYLLLALTVWLSGKNPLPNTNGGGAAFFLMLAVISVPASLGGGFACVEISLILYDVFKGWGFIHD